MSETYRMHQYVWHGEPRQACVVRGIDRTVAPHLITLLTSDLRHPYRTVSADDPSLMPRIDRYASARAHGWPGY